MGPKKRQPITDYGPEEITSAVENVGKEMFKER
jgi:hypothetical protein